VAPAAQAQKDLSGETHRKRRPASHCAGPIVCRLAGDAHPEPVDARPAAVGWADARRARLGGCETRAGGVLRGEDRKGQGFRKAGRGARPFAPPRDGGAGG